MKTIATFFLGLCLSAAWASGCGSNTESGEDGSVDCVTLCNSSKAQGCAINHGDCGAFCDAATQVTAEAGCSDTFASYLACADAGELCDTEVRCATDFNNSTGCAETYCDAHSTEGACQELTSQLQ